MFDIIKKVLMTEKSALLFKKEGKVTLEVARKANKLVISDAVESIWEVKVAKVRVINTPEKKKKISGRRFYTRPGKKKAIVTLQKGYTIELPGQFEHMGVQKGSPTTEAEGQ